MNIETNLEVVKNDISHIKLAMNKISKGMDEHHLEHEKMEKRFDERYAKKYTERLSWVIMTMFGTIFGIVLLAVFSQAGGG